MLHLSTAFIQRNESNARSIRNERNATNAIDAADETGMKQQMWLMQRLLLSSCFGRCVSYVRCIRCVPCILRIALCWMEVMLFVFHFKQI